MYERFTNSARKALQLANRAAQRLDRDYIGAEHILLGILDSEGPLAQLFGRHGIDSKLIENQLEASRQVMDAPPIPRTKGIIEQAMAEARALKHDFVSQEHILLAVISESKSIAAEMLAEHVADMAVFRNDILRLLSGHEEPEDDSPKRPTGDG